MKRLFLSIIFIVSSCNKTEKPEIKEGNCYTWNSHDLEEDYAGTINNITLYVHKVAIDKKSGRKYILMREVDEHTRKFIKPINKDNQETKEHPLGQSSNVSWYWYDDFQSFLTSKDRIDSSVGFTRVSWYTEGSFSDRVNCRSAYDK